MTLFSCGVEMYCHCVTDSWPETDCNSFSVFIVVIKQIT